MSILSSFINKCKEKKAELDERREFKKMVDEESKPIRRRAYMKHMLKESINEGIAKAKIDAEKRLPKKPKTPEEFGIKKEENQWAFLDKIGVVKENKKGPDFTIPKTKFEEKKKWVKI